MVEEFRIGAVALVVQVSTGLQDAHIKGSAASFSLFRGELGQDTVGRGAGDTVAKGTKRRLGAVNHAFSFGKAKLVEELVGMRVHSPVRQKRVVPIYTVLEVVELVSAKEVTAMAKIENLPLG